MKSIFFFFMIIPMLASGQKLLKPEVDKMHGDTTWITSDETIFTKKSLGANAIKLECNVSKAEGIHFLTLKGFFYGMDIFTISKGDLLEIKTSAGEIISLPAGASQMSDYSLSSKKSYWFMVYPVTPDELSKLTTDDVVMLRVNTSRSYRDFELPTKNRSTIKNALLLLPK